MKKHSSEVAKFQEQIDHMKNNSRKFTASLMESDLGKLQRAIEKDNEKETERLIEALKGYDVDKNKKTATASEQTVSTPKSPNGSKK